MSHSVERSCTATLMQIGNSQEAEKAFAHSIKTRGDHNSAVSMRMVSHPACYVLLV
jgi:hypothetical protein